jgi:predicted transcriptional regulator of viral defense system
MKTEKNPIDEIKEMIDYDLDLFKKESNGYFKLLNKVQRNENYVNYILLVAYYSFQKNQFFTISDVEKNLSLEQDNARKINTNFFNNELIIRVKRGKKFCYDINKDPEKFKEFCSLFTLSKKIKSGEVKYQ